MTPVLLRRKLGTSLAWSLPAERKQPERLQPFLPNADSCEFPPDECGSKYEPIVYSEHGTVAPHAARVRLSLLTYVENQSPKIAFQSGYRWVLGEMHSKSDWRVLASARFSQLGLIGFIE